MTDTLTSLTERIGIQMSEINDLIQKVDLHHKYIKDLKINLLNSLQFENLTIKETYLLAFATTVNQGSKLYQEVFEKLAKNEGANDEEIAEVIAIVSLMNVNNVFYRFRHYTENEYYNNTPAGIKMSIMINPILGKELFELISLAISALNGCEMCVKSHEVSVKNHGASEARVYDAIRLISVLKGFLVIA